MAEVISYAKSMALTRFKAAQNEGSPPPPRSVVVGFQVLMFWCFENLKNVDPLQASSFCSIQFFSKTSLFDPKFRKIKKIGCGMDIKGVSARL